MAVFLAKKPKVKSIVLTEAHFDVLTPLILRFKLNTGICTNFVQVFVDNLDGTAILGQHYNIGMAESLRVIKKSLPSTDLKTFSFIITSEQLWFDLYIYPILDHTQTEDKTIRFKVLNSNHYGHTNEVIELKIGRSRIISLGNSFGLKNVYNPAIGDYADYDVDIDHPPELYQGLYTGYSPAEGLIAPLAPDIDPEISLLINYDPYLFPGSASVAPVIEFVSPGYVITEANNSYTNIVELKRSGDLSAVSTVRVDVIGGTATLGTDYLINYSIYATFAPWQSVLLLPISIIEDMVADSGETIILGLSTYHNSALGVISTTTITVI